ncbi:MAG: DUF2490 domain-containing protein [Flavobacteriales bacterium]
MEHWFRNYGISIGLILGLLLQFKPLSAQEKQVNRSNQQWVQYYHRRNLSAKWLLSYDAGWRQRDELKNPSQALARAGMHFRPNNSTLLGAGFALFFFFRDDKLSRTELRPYQELMFNSGDSKIAINHRIRAEERMFSEVSEDQGFNQFNFRFRYRLQATIPILQFGKAGRGRELSAQIADEVFINAGKTIVYNALDNNRIIAGSVIKCNENLQVSLSYMFQFGQRNSPGVYESSDVLWLTFVHTTSR